MSLNLHTLLFWNYCQWDFFKLLFLNFHCNKNIFEIYFFLNLAKWFSSPTEKINDKFQIIREPPPYSHHFFCRFSRESRLIDFFHLWYFVQKVLCNLRKILFPFEIFPFVNLKEPYWVTCKRDYTKSMHVCSSFSF